MTLNQREGSYSSLPVWTGRGANSTGAQCSLQNPWFRPKHMPYDIMHRVVLDPTEDSQKQVFSCHLRAIIGRRPSMSWNYHVLHAYVRGKQSGLNYVQVLCTMIWIYVRMSALQVECWDHDGADCFWVNTLSGKSACAKLLSTLVSYELIVSL